MNLAFIGLGIMGLPMASHLLTGGHRVVVHSRTRSKAQSILDRGATWADSPADAARDAEVVFVCVTDTPDVQDVLFGSSGVSSSATANTIIVDHSTISPSATRNFASELAPKKLHLLDAPVSGGDVGAKNATLSIMCGGDRAAFDRLLPLLQLMGKTITYTGPSGNGQLTKLVNQILVVGTLMAVSEAMVFAQRSGLDIDTTLAAVGAGAAKSWQLEMLAPRMARNDFAPGFMVDLVQKDLRLVMEFAGENGIQLPATSMIQSLYTRIQEMGGGREGTQALFKAVRELSEGK
jgi:3-hydroxyisobutyrate dehydrogenase